MNAKTNKQPSSPLWLIPIQTVIKYTIFSPITSTFSCTNTVMWCLAVPCTPKSLSFEGPCHPPQWQKLLRISSPEQESTILPAPYIENLNHRLVACSVEFNWQWNTWVSKWHPRSKVLHKKLFFKLLQKCPVFYTCLCLLYDETST